MKWLNGSREAIPYKKGANHEHYDFTVKKQDGTEQSLADYKGKLLLVVNTATGCGFTPQYKELEEYYEEFKDQDFEILDFPCNQFAGQAPGTDEEIHQFCTLKYNTQFPQFSKIDVNGETADPLYQWLTANTKFDGFSGPMGVAMSAMLKKIDPDYKNNGSIKWNFTKFLIDRDGEILARFEPTDKMKKVREEIKAAL